MRRALIFLAVCALGPGVLAAQQAAGALADTSLFRRLELPAPTLIRAGTGAPGPEYWQQRVDYAIRATLDTVAKVVAGEERITYTNNSPDTLRYLWLQLDQNLFTRESRGSLVFSQGSRFGTAGAAGGVALTRVAQPAVPAAKDRPPQRAATLRHLVNGTMMRVDLPRPLPPGAVQVIEIGWSFPFGPNSNRMGIELIDGSHVYEVAQWHPRMAVYDDVRGWNTEQYYGQGEFHLEYGSYDVRLTVPADMIVAATGVLRNPEAVLTPTQRARLARARASEATVVVRGPDETGDPASRPPAASGMLTWRFTADSVRDFAWAAARHFVWDAVGVNGGRTLAMSFYPPSAAPVWKEATQYAKAALERYSERYFPYPYPTASNVNGIEGGMEYPMIVFCRNRTDPRALYSVTDHEFGHQWVPMVVGSNERLYGWMDEGLNSFMNRENWARQYPGVPLPASRGTLEPYLQNARSGQELPIMTPADRMHGADNWRQGLYNKPALGLVLLRERVTSPERFDPVFREYLRRWAYKHPTPADFFRTMEDGLGEDLSWFWRGWFYTTARLDQAVDSVSTGTDSTAADSAAGSTGTDSTAAVSRIHLRMVERMPMPVELELERGGGPPERRKLPVEIWFAGDRYTLTVEGRVTGVTIDPDGAYPDVDRGNNRWTGGVSQR